MQQKMVAVGAVEMDKQISLNAKVALYAILDFNKANVKPESKAAMCEIPLLLQSRATLNVLVVVTPISQNFESNRTLSQKRAKAIVAGGPRSTKLKQAALPARRLVCFASRDNHDRRSSRERNGVWIW